MPKLDFQVLPPEFYAQDTVSLARNLLGKILVFESPSGLVAGKIVETEAYLQGDPSSHSFAGISQRNAAMFEVAGTVYIYQIYGLYRCLNVVSNQKGVGEAVLIRALEPITGIEIMQQNRILKPKKIIAVDLKNPAKINQNLAKPTNPKIHQLCNGPAKLMIALGLNTDFNGHLIWHQPLFIAQNPQVKSEEIVTATRIGISKAKDLPLRFYLKDNIFVSRK